MTLTLRSEPAHRFASRHAAPRRYHQRVDHLPVDDRRTEASVPSDDPDWLRGAYEQHGSLVYTYCRRRLGPERAKDATQEVFTSAWNARARFDADRGSLAAWLMGIAKNRVIDEIRSEQRHADRRSDVAEATMSVDADAERVADRMLVADGLSKLPSRARTVIQLGYVEGLTHHEIAARTGIPIGTVKSDIRRGLTSIRSHLEAGR